MHFFKKKLKNLCALRDAVQPALLRLTASGARRRAPKQQHTLRTLHRCVVISHCCPRRIEFSVARYKVILIPLQRTMSAGATAAAAAAAPPRRTVRRNGISPPLGGYQLASWAAFLFFVALFYALLDLYPPSVAARAIWGALFGAAVLAALCAAVAATVTDPADPAVYGAPPADRSAGPPGTLFCYYCSRHVDESAKHCIVRRRARARRLQRRPPAAATRPPPRAINASLHARRSAGSASHASTTTAPG